MGRRKSPGLNKRGRIWWIDKRIKGYGRLAESCRTNNLEEAEQYLAFRLNEIRQATVYGVRPTRTFQQAAIKYLKENQHKRSLDRDVYAFNRIMPHIGNLQLDRIQFITIRWLSTGRPVARTGLRPVPSTRNWVAFDGF